MSASSIGDKTGGKGSVWMRYPSKYSMTVRVGCSAACVFRSGVDRFGRQGQIEWQENIGLEEFRPVALKYLEPYSLIKASGRCFDQIRTVILEQCVATPGKMALTITPIAWHGYHSRMANRSRGNESGDSDPTRQESRPCRRPPRVARGHPRPSVQTPGCAVP